MYTIDRILQPTLMKKLMFFLLCDISIIVVSLYSSFLLRLDFQITDDYYTQLFFRALPLFLVVRIMSFALFRLYQVSWRFVSLKDFYNIVKAVLSSSFIIAALIYFIRFRSFSGFPRSVIVIDALLTLLLISMVRISKRAFLEIVRGAYRPAGKRTMIVGAGNTGEMILRDIQKAGFKDYNVIAFLDDDPNRVGSYVHGIKVVGTLVDLPRLIAAYRLSVVMIAIPSLTHRRLREIYTTAKGTGVSEIKIVPRIYDVHRPEFRAQELEEIKIEDLIGRQAVEIDYHEIARNIEDRVVLVTGAGGSIGFELVRQISAFNPRTIILFDIDETELHRAQMILHREMPTILDRARFIVGDVRDDERVQKIFSAYQPQLIFHAAAYKHVPMMEYNADEAVKVNVLGTYNVVRAAMSSGVDRFVMISTDKAVKPTSIMGATKRMAEFICQAWNGLGRTEYVSVRFGNVLGSRGSVLPIFLEQIERGEAITITHQDMQRFFMTIPEAVSLVLQASMIGRGGDIMVLDMGSPVKIVEFAEELLRLHGLEPYKDIPIEFIGLRPGEKLFEEVLTAEEGTRSTRHERVFVAKTVAPYSFHEMEEIITRFRGIVSVGDLDGNAIRTLLKEHIGWYRGSDGNRENASRPFGAHSNSFVVTEQSPPLQIFGK